MFRIAATVIAIAFPAPTGAAPPPRWTVLADCAAAYAANSHISDPSRPPSMKAMIADQGADYAVAATRRYAQMNRVGARRARAPVQGRIAKRTAGFDAQTRPQIEGFIESCPQIGG